MPFLIIFLSLFSFFSISFANDAKSAFSQKLDALSHTYTHDLLSNIRLMQNELRALPHQVLPFVPHAEYDFHQSPARLINHAYSTSFCIFGSKAMLEGGLKAWDKVDSTLFSSVRGNLVLGCLDRFPFYLRFGLDYLPIGYHDSQIIASHNLITRSILGQKNIVFEIGGSRLKQDSHLKGAVSFFASSYSSPTISTLFQTPKTPETQPKRGIIIVNLQYFNKVLKEKYFSSIERYTVGGGVGFAGLIEAEEGAVEPGFLLNFYGNIAFLKKYRIQWEGIYNRIFIPYSKFEGKSKYQAWPHSLYIEASRVLTRMRIAEIPVDSAVIAGYELGSRPMQKLEHFQSNLLFAVKSELWTKRLTLFTGFQWGIMNQNPRGSFARINVSL